MKTVNTKPTIKLPTIKKPSMPSVGVKMPKLTGMINPLRLNK